MKRYVKSGVTLSSSFVGIINYNNQPIGYLAAKSDYSRLNVQTDPADLTKAHGVAVGSQRSIASKYRNISDPINSIVVRDNRQVVERYYNINEPVYYTSYRGGTYINYEFDAELVDLDGMISIEIVPADTDVTFVSLDSIAHIYPSLSESVPYLSEIKELTGGTDFIEVVLRNHPMNEVTRNGILYYTKQYPLYIKHIIDWKNKYNESWNDVSPETAEAFRDVVRDTSNSVDNWVDAHYDEIVDYVENLAGDRVANIAHDVRSFLREHEDEIPFSREAYDALQNVFIDILDNTELEDYELKTKESKGYRIHKW